MVERLRLEWTPEAGLPASRGRLVFTEGTDEEFLDVFRRIAVGSLDGETRRNLVAMGPGRLPDRPDPADLVGAGAGSRLMKPPAS
ncbi:hypothetical protein ACIQF5_28290 [Streptomyces goshikiensis]|uniref:hypothetical protein n=1 Tax=Streptomyces goshikiensis TaxID=1942 RepID=UPI00381D8862